jgi:tryptophan 2-monooxygenase
MATFIPNLRPFLEAPKVQAFVDTPNFVYSEWLKRSGGINEPIGRLTRQKIAVVGGGAAGCVAAFELQKCGADVTLFDAEPAGTLDKGRPPGGRLFSSRFLNKDGSASKDIAEMGAMRFPPSEEALFYYLDAFGIKTNTDFPDPGKHPTWVYYKGQGHHWDNSLVAPSGFDRVWNGWHALVNNGIENGGSTPFISAQQFGTLLQTSWHDSNSLTDVTKAWQKYLNEFGNDSFYSGLAKIFGPQHKWDVPANEVWTEEDFTRFGTLGIGSGGFGPLYGIGFNYIYRLLTNALETHQRFVPGGISQLCESFIDRFQARGGAYRANTRVTDVQVGRQTRNVTLTLEGGKTEPFDRVIVAMTTRAMELGLSITEATPGLPPNQQTTSVAVGEAIDRVHVVSSTKLFLRTKKFWTDARFPRNLLSDTKCPQLYTLDYYDPSGSGVVLVTYTWEDDSIKTQAFDAKELLDVLKKEIRHITAGQTFSDYADQLMPFTGDYERDTRFIIWQSTKDYFGGFTLAEPGQDAYIDTIYRDFGKAGGSKDNLVYIAGDCTSWTGGWADGALQSGLNCAAGVIKSLNGTFTSPGLNPITAVAPPGRYNYSLG